MSKLRILCSSIIQANMLKLFPPPPTPRGLYNILQILLILSRIETQVLLFAPKSQHLMTKYVTKKKKNAKQDYTIVSPRAKTERGDFPYWKENRARDFLTY